MLPEEAKLPGGFASLDEFRQRYVTAMTPDYSTETPPEPSRRRRAWMILLVAWAIGLLIWTLYIAAFVFVVIRVLT